MKQTTTLLLLLAIPFFAGCGKDEVPQIRPIAELESTYWVQNTTYYGKNETDLKQLQLDGLTSRTLHFGGNQTVSEYWRNPAHPWVKYYKNSTYTYDEVSHKLQSGMLDLGPTCRIHEFSGKQLTIDHYGAYEEYPLRRIVFKQVERDTEWDNEWKDAIDFDTIEQNLPN